MKPGSLGVLSACQTGVNPPSVTLTLNQTLKAGLHLVIVPGETPRGEPLSRFQRALPLRSESGRGVEHLQHLPACTGWKKPGAEPGEAYGLLRQDVALKVPGEPVKQGLRASVPWLKSR